MINRAELLSDLQRLLRTLEADLRERSDSNEVPEVGQTLRAEYQKAKDAERTAQSYEEWRSDYVTQIAAAWVLSCVFARFLEDNRLIDPPQIAGPGERLRRTRDEHELYFRAHPTETDREYLWHVFGEWSKLPGCSEIFAVKDLELSSWNLELSEDSGHSSLSAKNQGLSSKHSGLSSKFWLSGDAASELLKFFQKIDANTGVLVHDFTDPDWDTRFLGDLYQDLSQEARKKYALLQTPEFVEEFILDRALDPALDEFGLDGRGDFSTWNLELSKSGGNPSSLSSKNYDLSTFRMIDPACGSGHFLLGAFRRILDRWLKKEPGTNVRVLAQRALDSIHGVDVNPYAVAIARFRLLLAALRECGIHRLQDAPDFHFNLIVGDSLLHGVRGREQHVMHFHELAHHYQSEDLPTLQRILVPGTYHAVVANPPYITPKDRALNEAYRNRYDTCYMKYSLAVPFMERIFQLAAPGGYMGQITANSFMKREFGKKLIEEFLPRVDLTHVIDTSGAYIPGHGTPTVILFGRNHKPIASTLRTVMGIRGEPSTPDDPSRGLVWSAIVAQVDQPGSQSEFVSVANSPRELFQRHPWSIGGGGAAELKEQLEQSVNTVLGELAKAIGITAVTGEDELFMQSLLALRRQQIEHLMPLVEGNTIRDWQINSPASSVWLYNEKFKLYPLDTLSNTFRLFWQFRAAIYWRKRFGTPLVERGLTWYEWQELYVDKLRTPLSIAYAEVATYNHFVLDRGGKVFNRTAPVIKLPSDATEDDHLALLGLLNSSTACFWMKQVFHNKGSTVDEKGARQTTIAFENFYEFTGTGLQTFPVTSEKPLDLAITLDCLARGWQKHLPLQLAANSPLSRALLDEQKKKAADLLGRMIALQEELDWRCYRLYGLIDNDLTYGKEPPSIRLGQRAFEIVMARKMTAGELETTWFERHGSTPIIELPAEWPDDYKRLVERRIELIETDPKISLIEQSEYKRRWNTESWESQLERALRTWLLDRLESYFDFDGRMKNLDLSTESLELSKSGSASSLSPKNYELRSKNLDLGTKNSPPPLADIQLVSVGRLADVASKDDAFMQVAVLYRNDPAFDIQKLVNELVEAESVPLLPVLRYKDAGLRKRAEWERTWELQRLEDKLLAGENVDLSTWNLELSKDSHTAFLRTKHQELSTRLAIPVPPKYTGSDFASSTYWRLRGKLDVPKERWISFPHCEGDDGTLMIAWAGYDHLQLARAISAYYVDVQERLGGRDDPRLVPLLACLIELLPWLKQWHNDVDPEFGLPMGDYFEGFIQEEARQMGKTLDEIKAWGPPQRIARRRRGAVSA